MEDDLKKTDCPNEKVIIQVARLTDTCARLSKTCTKLTDICSELTLEIALLKQKDSLDDRGTRDRKTVNIALGVAFLSVMSNIVGWYIK